MCHVYIRQSAAVFGQLFGGVQQSGWGAAGTMGFQRDFIVFFFSGGCGVWTISLRHDGWFVFCVFFVYIMCLVCRGWSTKPWESLSTSINQLGSWRFLVIVEFVHSSGDRSDRWLPCGCSRVTSWTWRMDMYGGDDRGNEDKEDDDGRKMVVMMIMIMFEN